MSKTILPSGYHAALGLYDTQAAIGFVKAAFQQRLSKALHLIRVSAPLFVASDTGLNDDLNGVERPVSFDILETGATAQVVHSLAKWKRMALYQYDFYCGKGLYTDMNAIRRDEEMDNLHSIYVDQWDWEVVISRQERNMGFLKETVEKIVAAICDTHQALKAAYPAISTTLCPKVTYLTTQELEDCYPKLSPKEREDRVAKEYGTVCLLQIGGILRSGQKHDGRAPDYDDWDLNCDILFWNPVLEKAFEVSSMGIRVDAQSLDRQLALAGCDNRRTFPFHKMVLDGTLPLTMGGGIGQSRLCMLLMGNAHIGEVQVSIWDDETKMACKAAGIHLL